MAVDRSTLSAIRYGYGHRRGAVSADDGAETLLARLERKDPLAMRQLGPDTAARIALATEFRQVKRRFRRGEISADDMRPLRTELQKRRHEDLLNALMRPMISPDGLRERLVAFWTDHFTVSAKNQSLAVILPSLSRDAIRPHVTGWFADMLVAVIKHPAMLRYLDQDASIGPNSPAGLQRGRGLNENLAREILELHTLGTSGGYDQDDVREFAELLTGLRVDGGGLRFAPRRAEPGAEVILGRRYGGRKPSLAGIENALRDIALRPETARHLAGKLVSHFVASEPDPALTRRVEGAYTASGGDLMEAYGAMLSHPAAWQMPLRKVKPPFDFVVSALRALEVGEPELERLSVREMRDEIAWPLLAMGQEPFRPPGPDGWPEEAEAWITPPALSTRITWAVWAAQRFGEEADPDAFVEAVLRDAAPSDLRGAVMAAESRWEGVAVTLASPAFNRR